MVSVLLVSALAACSSNGSKTGGNSGETPAANSGEASAANSGASSGESADHPYKEKLSISLISRGLYTTNGAVSKDDKVVDFLNQKYNMDLTLNYVPSPNQSEIFTKLNSMIAANDIPDIMESRTDGIGGEVYRNLAKSGQLIDVEQFIKARADRYPNLLERISDPDAESYRAEDGKLYAVPSLFGAWDHAWFIRKDWLDDLGLSLPTTLAELHDVLKAFVEKDPDGKKNVGLTISNAWWLNHIYAGFTGGFNWTQKDGKYVYNFNRPEMKDALQYVHGLYAENLLDKEFFTHVQERDEIAKFTSGRAGVLLIGAGFFGKVKEQVTAYNPKAKVAFLPVDMKGPNGLARISGSKFIEGVMINKDTKDPERIFDLLEFALSEEGRSLFAYGVEGTHYTVDGNGNKVPNEDLFKKEGWTFGSRHPFLQATLDTTMILSDEALQYLTEEDRTMFRNFAADLNKSGLPVAKDQLPGVQINALKDVGSKPFDTFSKSEIAFITGDKNIDANWDEFQKTLLKQGFQAAMDEVNKQ